MAGHVLFHHVDGEFLGNAVDSAYPGGLFDPGLGAAALIALWDFGHHLLGDTQVT